MTCLVRLIEFATLFVDFEENLCWTSSVRQVFPPDLRYVPPEVARASRAAREAWGRNTAHRKSTPQKASIIVSGIFQWTFGGIFQRNFNCQWYVPKDCHFPRGFLLEMSNGCSAAFSN